MGYDKTAHNWRYGAVYIERDWARASLLMGDIALNNQRIVKPTL